MQSNKSLDTGDTLVENYIRSFCLQKGPSFGKNQLLNRAKWQIKTKTKLAGKFKIQTLYIGIL